MEKDKKFGILYYVADIPIDIPILDDVEFTYKDFYGK